MKKEKEVHENLTMSIIEGKPGSDQSKDSDTCPFPNIDEKTKEKEMIKEKKKR